MKSKNLTTILATLACFNLTAVGDVITPTGATSTTSNSSNRVIAKTIDGSGLVDVSDPSSVLDDEHPYVSSTDSPYWLSATGATLSAEALTFELGGAFDVDTVYYWKYTRDGDRNIRTFDVSYSTDGGTSFSTPVSAASLGMADWSIGPSDRSASTVESRTFTTLSGITHIRFSNMQNHGDAGFFGLHELRFGGVPGGTTGPVDAGTSTVDASPATVLADGTSTSTITVTLKDASGIPVGNEGVTLSKTSGPGTPVISPSATQTTNGAGVATFTVSSSAVGTEVFTATSSTDSVVVTDTASVEFQSTSVDAASSTVSASPTAVPANDITSSTITVTVRNSGGLALPGKLVSLTGDGENDVAPAGAGTDTTNASGVATFTVKSGTAGLETFTATSESVPITQTASVNFTAIPTGNVITPTGATSTSTAGTPRTIDKAIDGSGLTDISDPSSVLDDSHVYDTNFYWLSASTAVSAGDEELTFDLGGSFNVDKVYYWTYEREGDRNLRTFDISYSTDGGANYSTPVSAASLNMADWAIGGNDRAPSFVRTGTFDTLTGVTNIRFSNLQNHGDPSYFALYEIRFGGTLGPARITDFEAASATGIIDQVAKTISVEVSDGTDLATLAPTFTLSSGSCVPTSGAPPSPNFSVQNPATYTVTDTSTDPDTINAYTVTVTVLPPPPATATLVIDLGTSPAGTFIEGGQFIGSGPTNLPIPTLPAGSILRSIEMNVALESTDNTNWASDLAVLLDPTPGTPGGDFSVEITNGSSPFGAIVSLGWPSSANSSPPPAVPLAENKTDADWTAVGDIDLATTGLFLGNAYGGPTVGGTWSGTITLTYDVSSGTDYATWSGGAAADADTNGDGVSNAVAYTLGAADVDENAIGRLPGFDNSDPSNFVFTFDRSDDAEADGTTTITVEYGSDLNGWTTAANGVDGVSIDDSGASVGGLTPVIVTIPKSLAAGGKLFARLNVAVSP